MRIDHDQIFKKLIQAFFREFIELFCPGEASWIDFSRVAFLLDEYFTDIPLGDRRLLDCVARVSLRDGDEKYVLVHVEFEASRKEPDFARRFFRCFCQLFLRYDTEIVPVAVFSDDAIWKVPVPDHYEVRLPTKTVLRFDYYLIKLKHLDYGRYVNSANPLAYALMVSEMDSGLGRGSGPAEPIGRVHRDLHAAAAGRASSLPSSAGERTSIPKGGRDDNSL
jgi:hypothetical protein